MGTNATFLEIAEQLKPSLYETVVHPKHLIEVTADEGAFQGWQTTPIETYESLREKSFGKKESFILDFGDHQVGYLTMELTSVGFYTRCSASSQAHLR